MKKVKIEITKRKLTRAGKLMLWNNILFTLLWTMNLIASVRSVMKFDGWFYYQLIGILLFPGLIVFWTYFFIEECFMNRYIIKLDAVQKDGE